jgi:hypothetical protein
MFTKAKLEVTLNTADNSGEILELDMDCLNSIAGGDGATSGPFIGGTK